MRDERYHRQSLIEGWKQDVLSQSRVAVIGSDYLAQSTLLALAALGIGTLEIYDDATLEENKGLLSGAGKPKVLLLEDLLRKMNPMIAVKGVPLTLQKNLLPLLGKPDVLIDATNSYSLKEMLWEYAQEKQLPLISGAADHVQAELMLMHPLDTQFQNTSERYQNTKQGPVVSGVAGGLLVEELRKLIMPLREREKPNKYLAFSFQSPLRFSADNSFFVYEGCLKDKKALIIGAGALGNFVALGSAFSGIGSLDILDFDEVEATNLNRQVLFYDAVGRLKAEVLTQKIRKFFPDITARPIWGRINEKTKYFDRDRPDIIFDCVDSFAVRAYINYFAVKHQIPVVSGGTNPRSGQVVVYKPGLSSCLDCQLYVENALAEQRKAASCKFAPDPSVIMTNQIIAYMMVGEAIKVLDNRNGEPIRRILKYDADASRRGGFIGLEGACSCTKPSVKQWLRDVDGKVQEVLETRV